MVQQIGKHRAKLMGVCIISIVICHNTLQLNGVAQTINDAVRFFCQGGVDGFLILSGLGCYYSYYRTNDLRNITQNE